MIRFDCHAHVYEQLLPMAGARYVPAEKASLAQWLARQDSAGLAGGVIVQVSFLGTDNSQLLRALAGLDRRRFAGVAVTALDVDEAELQALAESGVTGLRWNLVSGAELPDPAEAAVSRLVALLRDLGMHLEVQLESPRLAGYLPVLAALPVPVVIDHLGLPRAEAAVEPWLDALEALPAREGIHVKISAPYRAAADPRPHLDRLLTLLPRDRFVWGSDWPHTRHEAQARYDGLLAEAAARIDDAAAVRALYRLGID
ncbi:amidohydrolase family protein [Pararhodobacter aggregans]|uniref:Amidohydrolase n=1 Tax=Pararhodobacter aggregans TaxID=404875 RepID=A0A2T7USB6_9RHOB|nr:amidohydrolase family protein [Pararhodobacter aggregans]PTX03303.1 putative TIM-barrel fold metal-dependent hydrolase [Pararhodobacter aggregans]PVE47607.1 amidohydrolase [Pararhodobacter aggregans]